MKILTIDIGSAQIKSTVFETKFNRFDVIFHDVVEVPDAFEADEIPADGLLPGQKAALTTLWEKHGAQVDRVITNIPFSLYTTRALTFPFSDAKKITSAAKYAIEDEIPFDLDKSIVTHQAYQRSGRDTTVLCGIAPIEGLELFLRAISTHTGVAPDVLTISAASSSAFLERQPQLYAGRNIAILNLGHRQSAIHIFKDCIPILQRHSMVGGLQITQAIAKQYGIGMAEAEVAKHKSGFLAPPGVELSEDQRAFSDLIAQVMEPVFHDFYQSLMAHFSRYHERVTQIYITGGTSLLPGVADYLAARWQLPVHPLSLTTHMPNISIRPAANTEAILSEALAMGIAQVEGRARQALNFRTGKLRLSGPGLNFNLQNLMHPIRLAATLYLLAIVSFTAQYFMVQGQIKKQELILEQSIRDVFGRPNMSLLYTLKNNPDRLRADAQKKLADLKTELGEAPTETKFSALGLIRELSQAVPKSAVMEIKQTTITPNQIKLRIESPTQQNLDSALAYLKSLKSVTKFSAPLIERRPTGRVAASMELNLAPGPGGK